MNTRQVRVPFAATCPRCTAGPHEGELVAKIVWGTLLFGGQGKPSVGAMATTTMSCPTTGEPFEVTVEVPVETGERVDSVSLAAPAGAASEQATPVGAAPAPVAALTAAPVPNEAPADWRADELAEWRKSSVTVARDAATKLLAAGTAAIGAYFAILKVVAGESITGGDRVLAIAPAIGYLLATVLAAIALLPVLVRVFGPDQFERFREDRLKRLSVLLIGSVSVFVLATVLAAITYAVLL